MKIAFIGQKGIPASYGGVEHHVEELVKRLIKNPNNEVTVYCRKWYVNQSKSEKVKGKSEKPTTCLAARLPARQGRQAENCQPITIFIPSIRTKHLDTITHVFFSTLHALTQDYDIIHYQGIGPALLSFLPRVFKPKTKVIVTYHCADYEHQKWGTFARLMLRLGEMASLYFPHQTIAVSREMQNYLQQKFGKKVIYIPNGVTLPDHVITELKYLQKWGLQKNSYFLTVNRLVRHKGIHLLIEAYQNLYPKPAKKDKKLVIVGDSAFTNDYVQELKSLAYGNPNIIFTGYQTGENLNELFANAYLYIQPSQSEGMALTVLEAMAYGKPVLTSDIPANLEVTHGFSLTFKNRNPKELKNRLLYALDHPRKLTHLAQKGQKWVQKNHNWNEITKETYELYEKLMAPKETTLGPSFEILMTSRV